MKSEKHIRLPAIMLLLAVNALACNLMKQQSNPQVVVNWDLSQSHTIQDVGWLDDNTDDSFARQGNILLTLKLPGGNVFKEQLTAFDCERRGRLISSIVLHLQKENTDEAYRDAKRLVACWQLDEKSLDQWYARRKQGVEDYDDRFETIRNDIRPARSLRIMHSFNDEKPWYINFSFSFIPPEQLK